MILRVLHTGMHTGSGSHVNRETHMSSKTPVLVSIAGRIVLAFIVLLLIVAAMGFVVGFLLVALRSVTAHQYHGSGSVSRPRV